MEEAPLSKSTQQMAAEEEKALTTKRLIVVGVVVFLAAFYYVWSAFLNFGTLEIRGDVPFDVIVFEGKSYTCDTLPCTEKLPRGEKRIAFYKHGYVAEGVTADVPLWGTTTVTANFKINPYLEEIDGLPSPPTPPTYPSYQLKYDSENHNWKLIEKGDEREFGLSYFAEKIEKPLILATDESVLIAERDSSIDSNPVYFIDLDTQQKDLINTVDYLFFDAKPSLNGRSFLLLTEIQEIQELEEITKTVLAIANKSGLWQVSAPADYANASWTVRNELALAYPQGTKWVFSVYNLETMTEKTLITTDQFSGQEQPENFFADPASGNLYFQAGEQGYKIVY